MAQFNSYRTLGNKYRRLGSPGGPIYSVILAAHARIAVAWGQESHRIMEKRIYNKYIPTHSEYAQRGKMSKSKAAGIARAWKRAGGTHPHPGSPGPSGEGKAWKRTHRLYQSQRTTFDINSVSMTNSARNDRDLQYAAARHNLGTPKSPIQNSIWTEVAQFQTEARQNLRNRRFFSRVYQSELQKALSIGPVFTGSTVKK